MGEYSKPSTQTGGTAARLDQRQFGAPVSCLEIPRRQPALAGRHAGSHATSAKTYAWRCGSRKP